MARFVFGSVWRRFQLPTVPFSPSTKSAITHELRRRGPRLRSWPSQTSSQQLFFVTPGVYEGEHVVEVVTEREVTPMQFLHPRVAGVLLLVTWGVLSITLR